jgi:hypothetical protein
MRTSHPRYLLITLTAMPRDVNARSDRRQQASKNRITPE